MITWLIVIGMLVLLLTCHYCAARWFLLGVEKMGTSKMILGILSYTVAVALGSNIIYLLVTIITE